MRNVLLQAVLDRYSKKQPSEALGNKNELMRTETSNSGVQFPCRTEPMSRKEEALLHGTPKPETEREMILHYAFGGCKRRWYKAW